MPAVKRSSSMLAPGGSQSTKRRKTTRNVVGNIGGRVRPGSTTLARAKGPFTNTKLMTFIYENELTVMTGSTNVTALSVMANSLFDFDKNGIFGNKQPLYYDTLLSASGPYKSYKVISWKTTYTIMNNSVSTPITVWAIPPISAQAEIDSAAEADNFPGTKCLYLGPLSSSKNQGTLTVYGHIDDVYSNAITIDTCTGQYNADPLSPCYQGLVIKGSDGSTAPSVYVAVRHEAYTQLSVVDSLVS